jgi:hypothetical protein
MQWADREQLRTIGWPAGAKCAGPEAIFSTGEKARPGLSVSDASARIRDVLFGLLGRKARGAK